MLKQIYNELRLKVVTAFDKLGGPALAKDFTTQYKEHTPRSRFGLKLVVAVIILAFISAVAYKAWTSATVARVFMLPVPVLGVKVHVGEVRNTIGASGTIQVRSTVTVASLVNATTVKKVLVNIGDIVKKDAPLLDLDQSYYEPALVAAQQQELSAKTSVDKDDEALQATYELKKQGLAEDVDIQTAISNLATAKELDEQAKELLAQAQLNLDFTSLKAPLNSIVITRNVDPGDVLTTNEVVLSLGEMDTVYFQALVQEDDLGVTDKGATAEVVFSSLPTQTFHGVIEKIDPTTDPTTRTFDAYVAIKNPDLTLKPGITGFSRISVERTGLVVPSTAVMNPFGETANVFVVNEDSRAVLTPVRLGLLGAEGDYIVLSGLKEGDVVVNVGTVYLKDNERVHVNFRDNKP